MECTSLRRQGDSNPSTGCVSYKGCSSLWWLAVAGLFVLLALLVVMVVAVNRQFAALAGRIAVLEAGGSCLVLVGSPPTNAELFIHAAA